MARAGGLAGLVLLAAAAGAGAQQPAAPGAPDEPREPAVRLRIGGQPSGGVFRPWAPLPVAFELTAPAGRVVAGRVRVAIPPPPGARVETVVYEADVTVPPGGKFMHLGIAAGLPEDSQVLEARWEVDGGAVATDRIQRLVALDPAQAWVLVLGGDAAAASGLGARRPPGSPADWQPPWIVTRARADLLPQAWAALSGADAIVLAGDPWGGERGRAPPPAPGLARALRAFVGAGGALLVAGGEEGPGAAGAAGDLCPVAVGATRPGEIRPLADRFSPAASGAEVPIAEARVRQGKVLASTRDGAPLLVLAEHGRGPVAWLACGLSDAPVREARVGSELLVTLLEGRERATLRRVRDSTDVRGSSAGSGRVLATWTFTMSPQGRASFPLGGSRVLLGGVPNSTGTVTWTVSGGSIPAASGAPGFWSSPLDALSVPVPASSAVGLLLVGYIVAIIVLLMSGRRLRRLGAAWTALGAGGVLSFAGLAAYAGSSFGAVLGGASITVAEGALADREVAAISSVGVYSPVGIEGRLEAAGPWEHLGPHPRLPTRTIPVLPITSDAGAAALATLVPRAPTGVRLEGLVDLGGRIGAEVEWRGERPAVARIRNGTRLDLQAVWVSVAGRHGLAPAAFLPGEEHAVTFGPINPPASFERILWDSLANQPGTGGSFLEVVNRLRAAAAADAAGRGDSLTLVALADGLPAGARFLGRGLPAPGPMLLVLHGPANAPAGRPRPAVRWWPVVDPRFGADDWLVPARAAAPRSDPPLLWQTVPGSLRRRHRALEGLPFDIGLQWEFPPPHGADLELDLGLTWEVGSDPGGILTPAHARLGISWPRARTEVRAASVEILSPETGDWQPASPGSSPGAFRVEDVRPRLLPGRELRVRVAPGDLSGWTELVGSVDPRWRPALSEMRILEFSVLGVRVLPLRAGK